MKASRRQVLRALAALVAGACVPRAFGQAYPSRPMHWISGFPPGGGNDVIARTVGPFAAEELGQQVLNENRAGATGTVAAAYVAKSPPDGYNLLVGAVSTNAIAPSLYGNLPYDTEKDLAAVTLLASIPQLIAVYPGLPIHSVRELIAYAKANPGKLQFASAGNGSTPHIAGEIFKLKTGTSMLHVPYKGAGQALPDVLAGRVPVSFDTTGTVMPFVRAGKLRVLAVAAPRRFALMPDVPTAAEAGLPDFEIATWVGLFAPGGTPASIVQTLFDRVNKVLLKPEVREKLTNNIGSDDSMSKSPADFQALLKRDLVRYAEVIKRVGIRVD